MIRLTETQRMLWHKGGPSRSFAGLVRSLNIDGPLLSGLLLICAFGLFVLYSAAGENSHVIINQAVRLGVAIVAMFVVAQLPPDFLRRWTPNAGSISAFASNRRRR